MEASLAEAQVLGQETEACVSEMWSPLTAPKPEVCSFLGDPEGAASPPDPAHELMSENLQLKVVEDLSLDLLRWWERCLCAVFFPPRGLSAPAAAAGSHPLGPNAPRDHCPVTAQTQCESVTAPVTVSSASPGAGEQGDGWMDGWVFLPLHWLAGS